jgi:hypothetical protein
MRRLDPVRLAAAVLVNKARLAAGAGHSNITCKNRAGFADSWNLKGLRGSGEVGITRSVRFSDARFGKD